jgi:cytochrome c oxidase subunit 2
MNSWLRRMLGLPEQASTIAKSMDYLHYSVILTSILGALGVGLLALYYSWRYRADRNTPPRPPDTRRFYSPGGKSLWSELFVFGGLLSLFVLWWVIGFIQYIRIAEPPPNSMTIYVVGKQWMWSFAYPNGGGSNGVLYVPANRPVKLVMTSRDVIHSFYVPAFRVKRDVIPGRSTTMWFEAKHTGRYRIECAEFCGTGHSTMLGDVVVLSDADYARMLAQLHPTGVAAAKVGDPSIVGETSPSPLLSLAEVGRQVAADAGCLRCHTVDGTPHIGPTWAGLFGARIQLEGGTDVIADEAYLTSSMMDPAAQLHLGFPAVMPSYQGLLTAPQVGALVEYIRTLRDVSRHEGKEPLPAIEQNVPIVTPLPGDRAQALPADDLQRNEKPSIPVYPPPSLSGGSR